MAMRSIATSPSRSENRTAGWPAEGGARLGRLVILGVEGDERGRRFNEALRSAGYPNAELISYRQFLEEPERLSRLLAKPGGLLRIESPGGDFETWRALARFGAAPLRELGETPLDETALAALAPDKGLILAPRQFHHGLSRAVRLAASLAPEGATLLNDAEAVALFCDKAACHDFMHKRGFPVPRALPAAQTFEELAEAMLMANMARVFLKPRYGSGAAGVVALGLSRHGVQALSSTEIAMSASKTALYNSSRMRRYQGGGAVLLANAILALGGHVEQWMPKAAVDGHVCDLRVLTIGGEVAHCVLRLSRTSITNLHLGAKRAPSDLLRQKVPAGVWDAMLEDCRRFASLFPKAFHIAFDVAILASLKRHVFFEVNAFGDFLRGVRHEGLDPYEWQVALLPAWAARLRQMAPS